MTRSSGRAGFRASRSRRRLRNLRKWIGSSSKMSFREALAAREALVAREALAASLTPIAWMLPHRISNRFIVAFDRRRIAASAYLAVAKPPHFADTGASCVLPASRIATKNWHRPSDGSIALKIKSRAVDGGLAFADADRRRGWPRDHARTQCFRDHGSAFHPRLFHAVPAGPSRRRI